MAAFAKPLLCAGRFISTNLNTKTMREVTDPREIEQMKQDLFDLRIDEQEQKGDYADRLDDGSLECCSDCGTPINSHDHCPRCDY